MGTNQRNSIADVYMLCPHCLKFNAGVHRRIPINSLYEKPSSKLKTVKCEKADGKSGEIPAALVYPQLLS